MKRCLVLLALAALVCVPPMSAAGTPPVGTIAVAYASAGPSVQKITLTWTSNASGAVSGNSVTLAAGSLLSVQFTPSSSAAPTDLYDVTFTNPASVDVLSSAGANRSTSASSMFVFDPPFFVDGLTAFDLVVANAGNAKGGTVTLWVRGPVWPSLPWSTR